MILIGCTKDGLRIKVYNSQIYIPIVCIECKTYLDKTMYEGSIATASKIKNGNPKCLFLIATETYEVSSDVEIRTNLIDNIYVLRKQRRKNNNQRNAIQQDVICHLLETIEKHVSMESKTVNELMRDKGYLRE